MLYCDAVREGVCLYALALGSRSYLSPLLERRNANASFQIN